MFDEMLSLLVNESYVERLKTELKYFQEISGGDLELTRAYILYRVLKYNNVTSKEERIKIASKMFNCLNISPNEQKGICVTLGELLDNESCERLLCDEIEVLTEVTYIEPLTQLGYVSEEVKRSIVLHEEIEDEDVESCIDTILQKFIRILLFKHYDLKALAYTKRLALFDRIVDFVYSEGDLVLMKQIQEIRSIILEWRE